MKHGTNGKHRVWRKLHIAVHTYTHGIVATKLSLFNVTDAVVLPNLLKQTRRKSLRYQVMVLMIQRVAMMLYESNERFRLFRYEKGQPSGNVGILAI
ncbi:transposase [Vibrio rotiferianus CAIM 577 = LMG 21460]|nr:transposase [Vibrio rotiferianus CAIM 577 = LMG 21460]